MAVREKDKQEGTATAVKMRIYIAGNAGGSARVPVLLDKAPVRLMSYFEIQKGRGYKAVYPEWVRRVERMRKNPCHSQTS